jgi:hypothetical protein
MCVHRRYPSKSASLGAAIASFLVLSGLQCPRIADDAWNTAQTEASRLLGDTTGGWRIHVHPKLLDTGAVVAPFVLNSTAAPSAGLTCPGRCVVFFVDAQPLHHFAHPTAIVMYDVESMELVGSIAAQWWPTIDGQSIFHTVALRREGLFKDFGTVPPDPVGPATLRASGKRLVKVSEPARHETEVWAIVVNGYDDPSNTFGVDTVGMYRVLQGLGVPQNHIQLLRPSGDYEDGITATKVSVENLVKAFERIPNDPQRCDDFLLFYSSHGQMNGLACGTDPDHSATATSEPEKDWLEACDLKDLLEKHVSSCGNVTLVLEACESGSFLDYLTDPTVAYRSGAGDGPWQMFVSAETGTSSPADVDTSSDSNVADSGSETTWGYVEAFGTAVADSDTNGWIDFEEAVAYAQSRDVSGNASSDFYISGSGRTKIAVHRSNLARPGGHLAVSFENLCGSTKKTDSAPRPNKVTRCCPAELSLTLENLSNEDSAMPMALRVFRPARRQDWLPAYYPSGTNVVDGSADPMSTTVMVPGLLASEKMIVTIGFAKVPQSLKAGDRLKIQSVIDHPVTVNPETGALKPPVGADDRDAITLTVGKCFLNTSCWLSEDCCPN